MKKLSLYSSVVALSLTLLTGCEKDSLTETSVTQAPSHRSARVASPLSDELRAKLARIRASLPEGYEQRVERAAGLLQDTHPEYKQYVERALGIEPTSCDNNTAATQWLDEQMADWNNDMIVLAYYTGMLDIPTYDALVFSNTSENQTFGATGEYSHSNTKAFKDLKRFWNIQSDGIVLGAMHGSMLLDRDRVIRVNQVVYGDSPQAAAYWADVIIDLLTEIPQYRSGNHPLFTFNAFAQSAFNFGPYGLIPSKIIMGDGIQDAFAGIGYADVAPQAILAHEFGHHIQFQLRLFGANTPEATRRTELMADAFSAYYLSHSRGAAMQWKRVKQFLQVFYNIGDCGFTNSGHHGTPAQRMAAAEWGYSVANNAQKQGHILTSQEFTALFEAQLPALVAPN
ncbi:neutral zinc metallopeptidase [Tellurirhabdus rosea]|uniref:hypothetical protein n=1 Tax=Tellurirhabdus rosea TaxID=2674997 RepID=UPI002251404E|nr:hypothetical protein [Tellurirhabdus rosea]